MTEHSVPRTALAAFFSDHARDAACAVLRAAGVLNVVPAHQEGSDDAPPSADVIVTDWPPPGFELATMLRDLRVRFGHGAETPVVMLSHRDQRTDLDAARRAGVDAYLVFPVSTSVLKHRLMRLPGHVSAA